MTFTIMKILMLLKWQKLKLGSESANCDITDNLLKEMLSLNEDMKDSDNSELSKETDIIFFEVIKTFCAINRG